MFDVVTVCAGKDIENLNICIESLKKNLSYNNLYVITNDVSSVPNCDGVIAIHDNEILGVELTKQLRNIDFPYAKSRFGWYFQQFLKMEFARSKYCKRDYLIWDADTVLLKSIKFDEQDHVFTKGLEKIHPHYKVNFIKLLGLKYSFDFSMISQHMFIRKHCMVNLLEAVELRFSLPFSEAVLKNIEGDNISLFSEYEFYANYVASIGDQYKIIERSWFRNASAVVGFNTTYERLSKFFYFCDYVALEKFDQSVFRRVLGSVKYVLLRFFKKAI